MSSRMTRRTFMKGSAAAAAAVFAGPRILTARSPNSKVNFAFVATGGQAGSHLGLANAETCVAFCDVDRNRLNAVKGRFPKGTAYTDYRKMLEKHEKEIDAVVVATPDHNHAPASAMALRMRKHVYCEKPLTWSIEEARVLAELTAAGKLATQMGNQGHANEGNRLVVEWVRSGVLGRIREVHTWTNRPIWPQGIQKRPASKPVPSHLDWDSWLGPARYRDFHDGLHPFAWRGWFDFGCGAVGDMGCHTWDCVNWAMAPDYPTEVELLKIEAKSAETFPRRSAFRWKFPAKGRRPAFDAFWYAGGWKPDTPEEMKRNKRNLPGSGSLFIGTKGKMLVRGDYGDSPRLLPEEAMRDFKRPPKSLPRSPGHHQEWVMACRGQKPWNFPKSNFLYAGPMTELMLLGVVAIRIGEVGFKIKCDPRKRTIKTKEALALRGRKYRKGWAL